VLDRFALLSHDLLRGRDESRGDLNCGRTKMRIVGDAKRQ
jgi:hypothetical protein